VRSDVQTRDSPRTIHKLLEGVVDYAGLFPPASLPLETAVQKYSVYRSGRNAWMLGRFVISASRLPELSLLMPRVSRSVPPWPVSALVGKDFESDMERIAEFNRGAAQYAIVDSVELAPELHSRIEALDFGAIPGGNVYFEIPLQTPLAQLQAIVRKGARAKVRTGGVRPEAIPHIFDLATFLVNCALVKIAFKATAGLHHPIRSIRPLTYEPNAVTGEMHGFLNLLLGAACALSGMSAPAVCEVLADGDPSSFLFTDSEARWRGSSLPASVLRETRERLLISFGSCSFEEPMEDLFSLGWL
jgi:hypothetical protein